MNRRRIRGRDRGGRRGAGDGGGGSAAEKPALLGGTPVHQGGWPPWPEWRQSWEPEVLKVFAAESGAGRAAARKVPEFEAAYAEAARRKTLPGHGQRHHGPDHQPARGGGGCGR